MNFEIAYNDIVEGLNGFIKFLKKKNKTVDECIFVDNSMTNVSAGRKIGIETIYISQNRTLQGYLKKINA